MDRYRTTANQRELDPSFSVPCRRCAGLLQEWNRFCPFCLEDQFAPADADGPTMAELARDGSPADQTGTAAGIDFVDTVQPGREGREEAVHFAGWADSMSRAMRDGGVSEISLTQPSDYWQTEVLRVGDGKKHWAARLLPGPRPLGIAVVLVLIAVAFFG
ncbi:MAG: hypothetical protein JWQ73_3922 [Variovorax sp.]|nr:hypothetical protein [Variovorax sp.]